VDCLFPENIGSQLSQCEHSELSQSKPYPPPTKNQPNIINPPQFLKTLYEKYIAIHPHHFIRKLDYRQNQNNSKTQKLSDKTFEQIC
jgi:hypothetical protein